MDKVHFEKFSRERRGAVGCLRSLPTSLKALPTIRELLEAYDKCLHRLLREFYLQLCNEDATINWERDSIHIK